MRSSAARSCRAVLAAFAVAASSAGAIVLPSTPAAAATESLGGTIQGEDGRYVSALIGIVLLDSDGDKIDRYGKPLSGGGYSMTVSVNTSSDCCYLLPGSGSESDTYNGKKLTKSWHASIPANTSKVWLEAYPKRAGGQPNTDTSRYGMALRYRMPVPDSNVPLRLPLRCGLTGGGITGNTGRVVGTAYVGGKRVNPTRIASWSTLPDADSPILGWGLGKATGTSGGFVADQLEPGTYTMRVTASGVTKQLYGVKVKACGDTQLNVPVTGSLPSGVSAQLVPKSWYLANAAVPPATSSSLAFGHPSATAFLSGDWTGDGDEEPAAFRAGTWELRSTAAPSATVRRFGFGASGDRPVVGDWDGDGDDEPGLFRSGTWYLRADDTSTTRRTISYGRSGDAPVVGDWDGDGDDDLGVFRTGTWILRSSSVAGGSTVARFRYGVEPGDRPVVGDWDGDLRDEPGIFRSGSWYLRNGPLTTGATAHRFSYGRSTDKPAAGDWNGDHRTTVAVVRS